MGGDIVAAGLGAMLPWAVKWVEESWAARGMRRIMSRPSKDDTNKLEALEGAAGLLAQVMEGTALLGLRLRQIYRRAPELAAVIDPADEELTRIVDRCDDAQELLQTVLEIDQAKRAAANRPEDG